MANHTIGDFIRESNEIEGITSYDEAEQIKLHHIFFDLEKLTIEDVCNFANRMAGPVAKLRDVAGMNVSVGNFVPVGGGPPVRFLLQKLLDDINNIEAERSAIHYHHSAALAMGRWQRDYDDLKFRTEEKTRIDLEKLEIKSGPFYIHNKFVNIHPFMDGNGRTGRAIWARQMIRHYSYGFELNFLHQFYYQSIQAADRTAHLLDRR